MMTTSRESGTLSGSRRLNRATVLSALRCLYIFQNFQSRQPSRSTHNAATRMCGRAAHIKVSYGRPELRVTRNGTQEEKLLQRELALKDVSFAEPEFSLQIKRRENLFVDDDVFYIRRVLGQSINHVVAERLALFVPVQPRPQLVGRVLNKARHDVLARRRDGRIGQRWNDDIDIRTAREVTVLGVVISALHVFHTWRDRNCATQMGSRS